MAYGKLYTNSYYTANGEYTTIWVCKKDYVGASSERDLGKIPLILKLYNEGDSRWKTIKGTQAIVELISESDYEFSDIFTAENYTYLLIVHKGLIGSELLTNRSFLANDDGWTTSNFTWSNQGMLTTGATCTLDQSMTFTQGESYVINVDYSNNDSSTTINTKFDGNVINIRVLSDSGGRYTLAYTHTDPTATGVFRIEKTTAAATIQIDNVSILKSGESHSFVPIFIGHSMQDTYIEPEVSAPYPVQLSFSNGLGDLKNNTFEESYNVPFIGQKQVLDIVNFCLQKTRLYLPVYTGIDIYDLDNDSDGDDPFVTKYVNVAPFKEKTCAEVLDEIFRSFLLNIKQIDATWQIVKITNLPYDISAKLYNTYNDLLDATNTLNYVQATDASNFLAEHNHQIEINPSIKRYETSQDYGKQTNLLNTNFSEAGLWSSSTKLKYWVKSDSSAFYVKSDDSVKFVGISKTGSPTTNVYIGGALTVDTADTSNATSFIIKLKYFCDFADPGGLTEIGWAVTEGETTDPMSGSILTFTVSSFQEWVEVEVSRDRLAGGAAVRKFRPYLMKGQNSLAANGAFSVYYKDFTLEFNYAGDLTDSETVVINDNNNKTGDKIELTTGDLPNIGFAKSIFENGLYTGEGGATSYRWALNGESISYGTLITIIKEAINYSEATPMQIFRGSLYGNWRLEHVLEFTSNSNKRYLISGATWNDKKSTLTGEFLELYYVSGGLPGNRLKINATDYLKINATDYLLISG